MKYLRRTTLMKVFVINHYAANKGDRAILYFICRELIRNNIKSITVSAHNDSFWSKGLSINDRKIRFVPWGQEKQFTSACNKLNSIAIRAANKFRRQYAFSILKGFLKHNILAVLPFVSTNEFKKALKDADLVIGTGGHHIQTRFTSESLSPLTYDMALTLLSKKPLVLWSQSIGPLDFSDMRNRAFVKNIIDSAQTIYLRDKSSISEIRKTEATCHNIIETFDSVIGLNDEIQSYTPIDKRDIILGISVYSAEKRSIETFKEYITSLAGIIDYAIDSGFKIRFFPMEMNGAAADDRPCIQAVLECVKRRDACKVIEEDLDTVTHLREVAKCRLFIGHKTHSQIFALTVGTPLIALAYHEKTLDFMAQYNLQDNCILDSELKTKRLVDGFETICQNLEIVGRKQYETSRRYGEHVRKTFSEMLSQQEY